MLNFPFAVPFQIKESDTSESYSSESDDYFDVDFSEDDDEYSDDNSDGFDVELDELPDDNEAADEMDVDDSDDHESLVGEENELTKDPLQKDMWQMRLFPYENEMRANADLYFAYVKTGLGRAVLHRNSRPGLIFWTQELSRFIAMYGRRFTKKDHVNMIRLLYSVLISEKLDFTIVQAVCSILVQLLSRKNLLSRDELTLEWKPLYKLYYEVAYKNLEEEGVFLLPEDLKKSLEKLIPHACVYFPNTATQEILDEIRPFLCPMDDAFIRGITLAYYFLPTCLTREEHAEYGATLWFNEFWHWYSEGDAPTSSDTAFVQLFGKLSRDSPFFVDWSGRFEFLFSLLLRSLKLDVGSDRVSVWTNTIAPTSMACLIAYGLGGTSNIAQPYLNRLFRTTENYFHPSNCGGHTQNLLSFVTILSNEVVNRVSRERYHSKRHVIPVPDEYKLTDEQIDGFVKSVLPCLEYAAFSKVKQEYVAGTIRVLSFLSPGIIIPSVLDLVFPALETLTEPHRLLQSLHILSGVCVALIRDDPTNSKAERRPLKYVECAEGAHLNSFRSQALGILSSILPGLDLNDTMKTALTAQIIGVLLLLIPVVDCSEAIYVRDDLTEEEKELCSATANFEGIVDQILEKLFSMIEVFGTNPGVNAHNTRQNLTKPRAKSMEEAVMERGIVGIIRSILKQCSSAIYDRVLDFFYRFMFRTMTDSRSVLDTVRFLIPMFVINNPEKAFPLFFDFVFGRLKAIITEETLLEDEVDSAVIWNLNLFSEVVHGVPGRLLILKRNELEYLLDLGTRFKCKDAINVMGRIIQNSLSSLISFFPRMANAESRRNVDFKEYLPIRHWGKLVDKQTFSLKWNIPSEEEIKYAQYLANKLIFHQLDSLALPSEIDKLSHNDLQKRLIFVRCAILGGSKLMPFLPGEAVEQLVGEPAGLYVDTICNPDDTPPITTMDGQNLRLAIYKRISALSEYVLQNRENDTKSMTEIISILRILMLVRGIDEKTYQPLVTSHRNTKASLSDPLRGPTATLETVMEDAITFLHVKRCIYKHPLSLNSTHVDMLKLLVRFGTSAYSAVRIPAQRVMDSCFNAWVRSYKFILDDVLHYVQNGTTVSHDQFKGALYILSMGKSRCIALRQDWAALLKIWPSLVNAHFSEKPSIVALMDSIQDMLVNSFASFEIYFTFPDCCIELAKTLLIETDKDVHSARHPGFSYMSPEDSIEFEKKRNAGNIQCYNQLCAELVSLCVSGKLHWRYTEIAQSLLALLLRRDIEFPKEAVLIFCKLLSSDTIRTRKTAVNLMSSWLRINKPKSVREIANVDKGENKPGAKWPIKYGIRKDNFCLMFKTEDVPRTAEQWDNTIFHSKTYIGYYIWPAEYRVYSAPRNQKFLNRTEAEFSETEREVIALLRDPALLSRLLELMSVEERKGSEEFNAATYSFFYGLTRSFNVSIVEAMKPFIEIHLKTKKEASQRLAAELVAGIVKGSKLWTYDKVQPLRDWLKPRLMANFEGMNNEFEGLWAQSLVSIFYDCEPRQVSWVFDMLMEMWQKPIDNGYQTSARLYFLHCATTQWEWRTLEQWHKLLDICIPMLGESLQNLRSRVAGIIADACQFDFRHMYVMPELEERFRPIEIKTISNLAKNQVQRLLATSLDGCSSQDSDTGSDSESGNGNDPLKKEKLIMLTYLSALSVGSGGSTEPHVVEFIPIMAHYMNDTKDEELRQNCATILMHFISIVPVKRQNFPIFLQAAAEALSRCSWWKARVSLLKFLQVFVFANVFIASDYTVQICELLFQMMRDSQLEVRVTAGDTLSGFLSCGYIDVDEKLLDIATQLANSGNPLEKHAGVIGLSAIILAFPYSVPRFLPEVLMRFCRHASEPQPIHSTVKKTLSEFKRTHQDSWHVHKQEFSEDQLVILTGLLVSPNYYV